MRLITITIWLFFILNNVFGQAPSNPNTVSEQTTWNKYNIKYNNPVYVIDGKPLTDSSAKQVLDEIDPYTFIKITILHASPVNSRNVVYITTDIIKIRAYQAKLSAFSKEYKNYLETHQNHDGPFLYFVNSIPLSGERRDVVDKLYDISADNIKNVYFSLQDPAIMGRAMVSITTK